MNNDYSVTYGPLVQTCNAFGISRNVAYKLIHKGLLKTFCIGRRRYIYLESLRQLPAALCDQCREAA